MAAYTCPDCGATADPDDVEKDAVVGAWAVTCADCGMTTIRATAYESADIEEHREEVA